MDFQNDPELEQLFRSELDERAASLADGARMMANDAVTPEISGRMLREGHTIKGTGRVMGYEGIARGGETSELIWRWVQAGDLVPSSMLARTLEHLARAIPEALGGGDRDISEAIDMIRTLVVDDDLLAELPEPPEQIEPSEQPDMAEDGGAAAEADPDGSHGRQIEAPTPDVDDADAIDDVSATLNRIEREIDAADGDATIDLTISGADGEPHQPDVAPQGSEDAIPLVFEPGPDGKLPTPVITYEIVSSAFTDGSPDTSSDTLPDVVPDAPTSESSASPATATPETASPSGHVDAPPALSVVEQASVLDPRSGAVYDLGGLVGAVETWATEESVPVNAGRLFRMINDVAALRIDLESATAQAGFLVQSADGVPAVAMENSLEMLATVRRASIDLETAALGLTTTPLAGVTATLPQLTKYLAKKVGREVHLVIEGESTSVDRQLVDRVGEIVRQLVVNAVAHGIEPSDERQAIGKSAHGTVTVSLSRSDDHVQVVVTDDGAGIDWKGVRQRAVDRGLVEDDPTTDELRSVLYSAGFSTSVGVTEFTGDGEGLARVTEIVEQVFGTMSLDSTPGHGTTFVVTLPAHRALQSAQVFSAGGRSWGLPASSVADIVDLPSVSIHVNERGSFISRGSEQIPYSSFATVAGLDVEGLPTQVMIVQSPTGQIALAVDDVSELRQVATKDLSPLLSGGSVVSGVALLGGEETVMLVDAGRLAERMREIEVRPEGPVHSVLVVDDSQGVRQVVSGVLASHGFSTISAGSVSDALAVLSKHTVDALVVDFSMPRADGVALIHMVRQRYGDIPVIMLSGVADDEDRNRAERAGANAFFDKADFAKGALVEKLRELVSAEPVPAEPGMAS